MILTEKSIGQPFSAKGMTEVKVFIDFPVKDASARLTVTIEKFVKGAWEHVASSPLRCDARSVYPPEHPKKAGQPFPLMGCSHDGSDVQFRVTLEPSKPIDVVMTPVAVAEAVVG